MPLPLRLILSGTGLTMLLLSMATGVPLSVGQDPDFLRQQQEDADRVRREANATARVSDVNLYASGDTVNVLCPEEMYNLSSGGGTDCWGYEAPDGTEYAIMGTAGGLTFVNVTAGQVIETIPQAGCGSSWRDMATMGHYCYSVTECTGFNSGLMVIDMSFLPDSAHLVRVIPTNPDNGATTSHNLTIDSIQGFLYSEGSQTSGDQIRIHDLSNPDNPVFVTSMGVGLFGSIHDLYANNDTLWVAEGNNPSWSVWDMANKSTPALIRRVTVPNPGYIHNIWPNEDQTIAVTTEETVAKTVKVWDVLDLNNVQLLGHYLAPSNLAHNAHVRGDSVYLSHYESGVRIVDISDPSQPEEVGAYDTYPSGESSNFAGCWGAFPYTNSGRIYGSNLDGRLFVLQNLQTVLADTLFASEVTVLPDETVKLDILATNSISVRQFLIPLNYGGDLVLTLDSVSTAGTRTDYFNSVSQTGFDPFNSRAAYEITAGSSQAPLPPGTGPILSVYFSISSGSGDPTNPITFTPYSAFAPSFSNICIGGYTPDTVSGSVTLDASCCEGVRGNVDGDAGDDINISDLTYLVNFAFSGGPAPPCVEEANVNADSSENINIADVTYLVNFMFGEGPMPGSCP